jgi:hypothetical protein
VPTSPIRASTFLKSRMILDNLRTRRCPSAPRRLPREDDVDGSLPVTA